WLQPPPPRGCPWTRRNDLLALAFGEMLKMAAALRKLTYVAVLVVLQLSCQTPSSVYYDDDNERLIIYASQDTRSVLKEASKHGSITEAIRIFKLRLKKNPRDLHSLTSLSRLYIIRADLDKAE